jgi:hypothetical protein
LIGLTGALLAAASLSLSASPPASQPLSLLDVPYISQTELLCGGAAAAMVLRYWGEAGVRAEDFASLVDESAGGISTTDLAEMLRARGFVAIAAYGTATLARAELAGGRPVIALVEDRPGTFHYVIIVGWHDRAVVYHDPARTPFVVARPEDFERRWKASRSWMLAVAPGERALCTASDRPGADSTSGDAPLSCDELIARGVQRAQSQDLLSAERFLVDAAYQCPGATSLRELAGLRLLQRRWPEVIDLASRAVAIDPSDTHSWQLLATSRYIRGDRAGALDAWNHAGEPILDLISVSGLQRTTHRTVERLLGLDPAQVLTPRDLNRARRRLSELPAALSTRLEYTARGQGRAEVQAHVAERPLVPRGRLAWAVIAARTAVMRELALGLSSAAERGERVEARWRFWPHRPGYGVALHLPAASAGTLRVEGFSEQQPFTGADLDPAEQAGARVELANWANGMTRWAVRGGFDRWNREGTFGVLGGGTRIEHRGATLVGEANVWVGDVRFATGAIEAQWVSDAERRTLVWVLRGGLQAVGERTPLALWPAGDTGHARSILLRAHPVLDAGRLDVQRLGRRVAYGSMEIQRWRSSPGPLAIGVAGFLDLAQTGRRFAGAPHTDLDVGLGLRVGVPGARGHFRVDMAHGTRDGRNILSAAWEAW